MRVAALSKIKQDFYKKLTEIPSHKKLIHLIFQLGSKENDNRMTQSTTRCHGYG